MSLLFLDVLLPCLASSTHVLISIPNGGLLSSALSFACTKEMVVPPKNLIEILPRHESKRLDLV